MFYLLFSYCLYFSYFYSVTQIPIRWRIWWIPWMEESLSALLCIVIITNLGNCMYIRTPINNNKRNSYQIYISSILLPLLFFHRFVHSLEKDLNEWRLFIQLNKWEYGIRVQQREFGWRFNPSKEKDGRDTPSIYQSIFFILILILDLWTFPSYPSCPSYSSWRLLPLP